jgi:hypothetical protein
LIIDNIYTFLSPFWEALIEKFLEKLLKYVREQNYASKRLLKYDNWPKKDKCRRMLRFINYSLPFDT